MASRGGMKCGKLRDAAPVLLGALSLLVGLANELVRFGWPLAADQNRVTTWEYFRSDVISGQRFASCWHFYCLGPILMPSSMLKPLGQDHQAVLTRVIWMLILTATIWAFQAVGGSLSVTVQVGDILAAPEIHGMSLLSYPLIAALGHLVPSRPSLVSQVGGLTFMCLLVHWSLILWSHGIGRADPWKYLLDQSTSAHAHGGRWGDIQDVIVVMTIAALVMLATSFSIGRAAVPRLLQQIPGPTWLQPVRHFRPPYPQFPSVRAAMASWIILLLLGFIQMYPSSSSPAGVAGGSDMFRNISALKPWRSPSAWPPMASMPPPSMPPPSMPPPSLPAPVAATPATFYASPIDASPIGASHSVTSHESEPSLQLHAATALLPVAVRGP